MVTFIKRVVIGIFIGLTASAIGLHGWREFLFMVSLIVAIRLIQNDD